MSESKDTTPSNEKEERIELSTNLSNDQIREYINTLNASVPNKRENYHITLVNHEGQNFGEKNIYHFLNKYYNKDKFLFFRDNTEGVFDLNAYKDEEGSPFERIVDIEKNEDSAYSERFFNENFGLDPDRFDGIIAFCLEHDRKLFGIEDMQLNNACRDFYNENMEDFMNFLDEDFHKSKKQNRKKSFTALATYCKAKGINMLSDMRSIDPAEYFHWYKNVYTRKFKEIPTFRGYANFNEKIKYYYKIAKLRSDVMFTNLIAYMDQEKKKSAIGTVSNWHTRYFYNMARIRKVKINVLHRSELKGE